MTRHHKIDYQRRLTEELKLRFSQNLELERQSGKAETESLSEVNTNKVIKFLNDSSKNAIICDAPEENPGGEELLSLIPEPIRLRQNYETRIDIGSRISGVYNKIYKKLMKHSSKGRIFCHPHIRNPLLSLESPDQIKRWIIDAQDL